MEKRFVQFGERSAVKIARYVREGVHVSTSGDTGRLVPTSLWMPPGPNAPNRARFYDCSHSAIDVKKKFHGRGQRNALVCAKCWYMLEPEKHPVEFTPMGANRTQSDSIEQNK